MLLLRRGSRGAAVAEIRAALGRLELLKEAPGSVPLDQVVYDEACERAVREFQQHRGLSVDGIIGPETYRALGEARWRLGDRVLSHVLTRPFKGDDVAALQERLLELGFNAGRHDGVFGPRTEAALRDFQRNRGMPPDGTCGPATLRELDRLSRKVVGGRPQLLRETEEVRRAGPTLVGKAVVIDPGHGGDDPGATGHGLVERDVVLDLARRLEGRLAAAGVTAFLTHAPDANPSAVDRAALANETGADLLLSLHVDGQPSPRPNGVATYHFGTWAGVSSTIGERLAGLVQREIVARTGMRDCGTHAKTWDLLRSTRMPAIRLELGYVSNPDDAAQLASPDVRNQVAEAILVAVQRLYLPPDLDMPTGQMRLPVLTQ